MASYFRQAAFITTGLMYFTRQAYEKRKAMFSPDAIPADMKGKVHMITGANSGIGYATARALLQRGATVHLVCRNPDKGEQARQQLIQETGNAQAHLHIVDISNCKQVRAFARSFVAAGHAVHSLVNNAGCMVHERKRTSEGFELNFATNVLNTFLLTEELLPALRRTPQARVVTVSSGGMLTQNLPVDDLQRDAMEPFDAVYAYASHKRCQVALTEKWARLYRDTGVVFQSMHPGWADTPAVREAMPDFHTKMKDRLRDTDGGADTIVWLVASNEADKFPSGEFFLDRAPQAKHLPMAWSQYTEQDVDRMYQQLQTMATAPVTQPTEADLAQYSYLAQQPAAPSASASVPSML